mgnify:CR=1 FL=1
MDKSMFEGKIGEISNSLKAKFANLNLSEEEIRTAMQSPDDLVDTISAKTGLPKEEAKAKVHEVMSELHIDDEMAKSWMAKFGDKVEHKYAEFKSKFTH